MAGTITSAAGSELLLYAAAQGIIDLAAIQAQIEVHERKKFLEMHKNKIWKGANGKWYTELPPTGDTKRKLVKKTHLEDLEEEIINFYRTNQETPTFRTVYNEWLEAKQDWQEISRGTVDRYNVDFIRFFEGTELPGMRVDYIDDDFLEDFIKKTIAKYKLTNKAYSNMKTLLLGVMKYAKKRKYTQYSVSSFFGDLQLSKKTFKTPEKKKQVFTEEEAEKIIKYLKQHPSLENYGILLAFQTGVREGELAALKYSDIEDGLLHVQRQEIKYKGENPGEVINEVVPFTKSAAGDRFIILTDKAQETIKALRRINPFNEYIFFKNGQMIHKQRFNEKLYQACEKCGVAKMSMHKIRKTYATMLINAGTDESTITEQMGHSDITTTKKYYYFDNKNQEEKAQQVREAIPF